MRFKIVEHGHTTPASEDYAPPLRGAYLAGEWKEERVPRMFSSFPEGKTIVREDGTYTIEYKPARRELYTSHSWPFFNIEAWEEEGRNHRVTETEWIREVSHRYWVIDLNTIDEIVAALIDPPGQIILDFTEDPPIIEVRM